MKRFFIAIFSALVVPHLAFAADIAAHDPHIRVSRPGAPSAAAFMVLMNHGTSDDRLVDVRSDIAKRVELHAHRESEDGIMQMIKIEEGIPLPAGTTHELAQGGDHVMLMGLTTPLTTGDDLTLTLVFEMAGEITMTVPVYGARVQETSDHSDHSH